MCKSDLMVFTAGICCEENIDNAIKSLRMWYMSFCLEQEFSSHNTCSAHVISECYVTLLLKALKERDPKQHIATMKDRVTATQNNLKYCSVKDNN